MTQRACPACGYLDDSGSAYCLDPGCGARLKPVESPSAGSTAAAPPTAASTAVASPERAASPIRGWLVLAAVLAIALAGTGLWLGTAPFDDRAVGPDPGTSVGPGPGPGEPLPATVVSPPVSPVPPLLTPTAPRTTGAPTVGGATRTPRRTTPPPAQSQRPPVPYVTTASSPQCRADGSWVLGATAQLHNAARGTEAVLQYPLGDGNYHGGGMAGGPTRFTDSSPAIHRTESEDWYVEVKLPDGRRIKSATKVSYNPC